jgi:membrane protease subunit HflK
MTTTPAKSPSSRRPSHWGRRARGPLVGVVGLAWLASGFYTISPSESGVATRFGAVHETVPPGMHYALPWPIDRVHRPATAEVKRIEVGVRCLGNLPSEPRRTDMLTGDENILKIMMVVQYKIRDPKEFLFAAEEPHWLVERTVESAMNEYIAHLSVDDVLTTAKSEMQVETIKRAQAMLDAYRAGVVLLGGNLQDVSPPAPVVEAFKEVASAKKDSERLLDEAREYESRVLPKVAGDAEQMISQAEGYRARRMESARGEAARFASMLKEYSNAKQMTRVRLFMEMVERVMGNAKLVILGEDRGGRSKINVVEPSPEK